jgi:hypothetical protein
VRLQRALFLSLLAAAAIQIAWFYPSLPPVMASHFDAAGRANAAMPRLTFVAIYAGVLALVSVTFLLLPSRMSRYPDEKINLPNKAYWLAPERRAATFARLGRFLLAFGNATLVLLLLVFQLVFRAAVTGSNQLPRWMPYLVGTYVAFALVLTVRLHLAFRLPRR